MGENEGKQEMHEEDAFSILVASFKRFLGDNFDRYQPWLLKLASLYEGPILLNPGEVLWDMGETRADHFFVVDGFLSEYWINDFGEAFIYAFIGSREFCVNEFKYLYGEPSRSRLEVLQPTRVLKLKQEAERELRNEASPWEQLSFEVGREILAKRRERIRWLSSSKEVHLEQLAAKYPVLLKHSTKEHLAAYLGVSRATVYRLIEKKGLKHGVK
jgi:CRP-like cAMP-binding protein